MSGARRVLAAPSIGERGGGVGQVSAMLWDVVREAWPDSGLSTLIPPGGRTPGLADKLRFGAELAAGQMSGRSAWVFFTHLGLVRAEGYVPSAWRAPYGVFLHGIESWAPLSPRDRELLRNAKLLLANSEFTARRAVEANPDLGRVITCPLALPDGVRPKPAAVPRTGGRLTAVIVGRMESGERYKGHDQLIDVWRDVTAIVPAAELVVVGDGSDRARLEARARHAGPEQAIRFTGFLDRDALDRVYEAADVFVLPSRGEGFGLVYLEAMSRRLPCIGSIHDAAAEVIVNGATGLLVDLDRRGDLGRAIVRLLTDASLRQELGGAGYERLRSHFTYEQFKRRILAEFDRTVDRAFAGSAAVA